MIALPAPPLHAAALVRQHIATPACPLPTATPGITWIVASNGVFKRGVSASLDVLVAVDRRPSPVPGLAQLLPHVRFASWPGRLPGQLLTPLLRDAAHASAGAAIAHPIEKQYFLVWRDGTVKVIAPRVQVGTAASLRYTVPERGEVLCDVHSHHGMAAYHSPTDDRDDTGLSVSVVIGRLFTEPELVCRLNVYGHRMVVGALTVFDGLGPFRDAGGQRANLND